MNSAASPTKFLKIPFKVAELVWNGFTTMVSENKIPRVLKRIGTHSGGFHCDEALACFMLKQLPEYEDAEIIRTRNSDLSSDKKKYNNYFICVYMSLMVMDVGKRYTTLSSAGLIYVHFGMEIIAAILKNRNYTPTTECLKGLFLAVYEGFIEELDAIDNGIPMYADGHPKYRINTHLSARVHRLNPEWNTKNQKPADELFQKAMNLVGNEFTDKVVEAATVWWPAREIVKGAILDRKTFHPSGEIVKLGERCPWKDHLLSLEEELGVNGEIKFIIFHDPSDSWRIQGIPIQPDSFICRVFLHKNWRGERDEQLQEISGVEGAIFCHPTGFIGGTKTMEGALKMAVKSLEAAAIDRD
ncbi:metal dependent hydrolase - related [Holotrichia oblita]|uniref:Metal dependent hydrolase - related n=1 Tax=Holotrichia oblita TaxID=644536 RepID=A0ACB9TNH8_HOLOL|nr:metal dependent hydrolase - related [Holotrichia oblita]